MVDIFSGETEVSPPSLEKLFFVLTLGGRLERADLELAFPHNKIALVGSCATVSAGNVVMLDLLQSDFDRYTEGHFDGAPVFPGHWLGEMAALAAGLLAQSVMAREIRQEVFRYKYGFRLKGGDWLDKPLAIDLAHPIIAIASIDGLKMEKPAAFTADVRLCSDNRSEIWSGIRVRLGRKIPRSLK